MGELDEYNGVPLEELKATYSQMEEKRSTIVEKLNIIDKEEKRLKEVSFLRNDLEKNERLLEDMDKPLNKLKRSFSSSEQEKYNKVLEDIKVDKKFLSDLSANETAKQAMTPDVDLSEKNSLLLEYNLLESGIQSITNAIAEVAKDVSENRANDKNTERNMDR
jgi:hypothetical protein